MISSDGQINRKTYSQCGAAADAVFTTQPLAFLIRSTTGHERPLDHTLRGLSERKGPRHLAHTHTHRLLVINTFRFYKPIFVIGAMWYFYTEHLEFSAT